MRVTRLISRYHILVSRTRDSGLKQSFWNAVIAAFCATKVFNLPPTPLLIMGKTLWHNWIGGYYIERYTSGIERIGIYRCILFNRAWNF